MAPIPEYLKQDEIPVDVSSRILSKVFETPHKSLTAEVASSWVAELETNIQQTKSRICGRIKENLSDFSRQLDTSKSVQTRLTNLSSNIDKLSERLSDRHSGLLPTLLRNLRAHNELAQRAADARVTYDALAFLQLCRDTFKDLNEHVARGMLENGVRKADELLSIFGNAPLAVSKAQVMSDMMNRLRALKDRIEEQLSDAYSRSIHVTATDLRIAHSVQVRQSTTVISLGGILASLSSASLASHISSLLRDIGKHYLDLPLQQPVTAEIEDALAPDGTPSVCLSIFPLSPSADASRPTLLYLKTLFDFLDAHLLPSFPKSSVPLLFTPLRKLAAEGLLKLTIRGALPNSLNDLSAFLDFLQEAVILERSHLLEPSPKTRFERGNGVVEEWAGDVAGHFGRKRQIDQLEAARTLILSTKDDRTIRVEAPDPSPQQGTEGKTGPIPSVVAVQGEDGEDEETGWDFEDDARPAKVVTNGSSSSQREEGVEDDADGWDLDEPSNMDDDPWGESGDDENGLEPSKHPDGAKSANGNGTAHGSELSQGADDSAWDTNWDEEPVSEEKSSSPPIKIVEPAKAPRVAKGLEKLSSKAKAKEQGRVSPSPSNTSSSRFSTSTVSTLPSSSTSTIHNNGFHSPNSSILSNSPRSPLARSQTASNHQRSNGTLAPKPAPLPLSQPAKPKDPETYLISGRAQDLVKHVFRILDESNSVAESSVFSISCEDAKEAAQHASSIISQAAPSSVSLYRAIYPVAHASELAHSTRALRFANECTYIASELVKGLGKAKGGKGGVRELLKEESERLEELGLWWFDEGLEHEFTRVSRALDRAEDFVDMGDQERYDVCEGVVMEVMRTVRAVSGEWKPVLSRTQHLTATGRVVEHALTHVLNAVLALPDIPEVDSRRLAELCRVLGALESLFIVDPGSNVDEGESNSMVLAFVPSWLKFSYLSELLEASLADLSYLFEQGALIDFSVDELVSLVRALFADTPARSNAIAKLMRGHPQPDQIS